MTNLMTPNMTIDQAQDMRTNGFAMVTNRNIDTVLFVGTAEDADKFADSKRKKVKGTDVYVTTVKVFYKLIPQQKMTAGEVAEILKRPNLYSWNLANNSQI